MREAAVEKKNIKRNDKDCDDHDEQEEEEEEK